MKKLLAMVAVCLALSACTAEQKTINGVTYDTYGLANKDEKRNPGIDYEVSGWSVFWAVLLCETVVAPIYFIGWDWYQPVGAHDPNAVPGQVGKKQ